MAYGIRMTPLAENDLQPRRSRRVHVRPHDLPGQLGVRRLLRADREGDESRACCAKAEQTPRRMPTIHGYKTIADIMRAFNPFSGELYLAGAADQPDDARDVLPDGRAARPSVDALSRRYRNRRDAASLHRLHVAPARRHGLHQARRADERRRLRLLLRGAARIRRGRAPPHRCSAAGARFRTRKTATTGTST